MLMNNNQLQTNGLITIENFINSSNISKINNELDLLFIKESFNGGLFSISPNRFLKTIHTPAKIKSLNLFEISIDIFKNYIEKNSDIKISDYRLSNLEIFSEKGNYRPLFWHTDNRKGTLRAIIYLKGGKKKSGAFRYIFKTNNNPQSIEHKLSQKNFSMYKDQIHDCIYEAGTLIIFNPIGYHAKYPCIEERRAIFMEFQDKNSNWPKNDYLISTSSLSHKVVNNINFFHDYESNNSLKSNASIYTEVKLTLPLNIIIKLFVKRLLDIKNYKSLLSNIYYKFFVKI